MKVPPLSKRLLNGDDEQISSQQAAHDGFGGDRDDSNDRPTGMGARAQSWMRADAVGWGIRVAIVGLFVGGFYAVYINGVAEGWWRAWDETPTVAATTTPTTPLSPAPSTTSEPAMSGGYEIGPDGVLIRPAEHAASTYTKPELPEEAKENTQRGAEAAAEHYLALLIYSWNTGDTQPLANMSDPSSNFAKNHIANTQEMYTNGWSFGNSVTVQEVLRLEAVSSQDGTIPPNTIGVRFRVSANNGTRCKGKSIIVDNSEHSSTITLFMTWKDNRWTEVQGSATDHDDK